MDSIRSFVGVKCPAGVFSLSPLSLPAVLLAFGTLAAGQLPSDSPDIPYKPLSAKEKKEKEEKLRRELMTPWKHWLNEDVAYIITAAERRAFESLQTDEERQYFVEQFWQRRNPKPDSLENAFEDEHYRRIAYANERYASGVPGWKTDRGGIYVLYGPPDEIEAHAGKAGEYPSELWRYRRIEGLGNNVEVQFVDVMRSGEYHITADPSGKDFLNAGLALNEQLGICPPCNGTFQRTDGAHLGVPLDILPESMQDFTRLENAVVASNPPRVRFKDLEEVVSTNIRYATLPMKVQAGYIRVTDATVLTPITVLFTRRDLQSRSNVNIFGRVRSASRVVTTFEDVAAAGDAARLVYQKVLPLAPGAYHLNVVAKDVVGGRLTNYEMDLNVPRFDQDELGSSSLILADLIQKAPTHTGQFVIGEHKVRPRIGSAFMTSETLGIYEQFYNFAADAKTGKPNASIEYLVTRNDTGRSVFDYTEEIAALPGASPAQVTVDKLMPLRRLGPGQYTIQLKVTDRIGNRTLAPGAAFTVTEDRAAIDSTMPYGNRVPVPYVSLTATGAGLRMRTVFQRIRVV